MTFESDLKGWAERTNQKLDQVVRQAVVLAAQGVVLKSPVGNPDLWKGPAPEGYVGGRLRASWQLGIGSPDASTTTEIDSSGGATIQKIAVKMQGEHAGNVFYVTSSLPYTRRIEYEGHSSQAPGGMVRVTFAELPSLVEQFAKSIK
jgi:hypothetical protein